MAGFGIKTTSGVLFDEAAAQWAVLRENRGETEVQGRGQVVFDEEHPMPGALDGIVEGALVIAVPARFLLLRIMDLPTVEPAECRGMVELQVGKISPFPVEDLVIAHEILEAGDSTTRMLIASVEKSRIDELGAPLIGAGLVPEAVDIDIMADWYALGAAKEPRDGRVIHLVARGGQTGLLAVQDGKPLILRALPPREERTEEEQVASLAEEVDYTLTSLESEWGPTDTLVRIHGTQAEAGMASPLEAALGIPVQWASLDALMDRGEALVRRRMEGAACLNLRPDAWRELTEMKRVKRRLVKASIAAAAIWLVTVASLTGYLKWEESSASRVEREAAALQGPAMQVSEIKEKVENLEHYGDRMYSALECLREISVLLPPSLELQAFNFRKDREINLRGVAESARAEPVYDFFEALEQSDRFVGVHGQQVTTTRTQGGQVATFRLTLRLPEREGSS